MNWYFVKLRFETPVHLGSDLQGVGVEQVQPILHADTLFSAFCNAWARYRIALPDKVGVGELGPLFNATPPFLISSAFPYLPRGAGSAYYLPRPHIPTRQFDHLPDPPSAHYIARWKKQLKNARFVPDKFFEVWLKHDTFVRQEENLEKLNEWQEVIIERLRPQHAQDRLTDASQLYHLGEMHFDRGPTGKKDSGLYFLVCLADDTWVDALNHGLRALSQDGLGGERNFGLGRFTWQSKGQERWGVLEAVGSYHPLHDLLVQPPSGNATRCVLSPCLPTREERRQLKETLIHSPDAAAYGLVPRRGWTFSTTNLRQMKRESLYMFDEGSTFSDGFVPKGMVEDVAPQGFVEHPIWRYGLALSVPLPSPAP